MMLDFSIISLLFDVVEEEEEEEEDTVVFSGAVFL